MKDQVKTGRLLLLVSVLLVMGFVTSSLISYFVSRHALRRQIITNELPLTSDNIYSEIQRDLLAPVFISSLMANDAFLRNWVLNGEKDPVQLTQFLHETQRKYKTFTSFFVSEHTRIYYQSKGILKKVTDDNRQDLWYFRVRKMAGEHEINVDPDQANQYAMTIFVNHKVLDFNGNYIGATGVGLQVNAVKQIIESYHRRFNRVISFVSPNGEVVLSSAGINPDNNKITVMPGLSTVADAILKSKQSKLSYTVDGRTVYVNSRFIPELNWYLLVEQSDEAIVRDIYRTLMINLVLCVLVTIVVVLMINLIINAYRRRLRQMLLQELVLQNTNNEQQREIVKQHEELVAQNERLLQLNASKDKLFSIIAHDLRSPIGNITQLLVMLENSLQTGGGDKASWILSKLKELSGSSSKILENLFDWAKSQMSEIICEATDFQVREFLVNCVEEHQLAAQKKNIAIILKCNEDLQICADRNMIMTVVRNLISNAIKFTPRGGRIDVEAIADGADRVTISIRDSGIGIAAERLDELFDFAQSKSTFGTDGEIGTGLGLSLCRELVHKNGGQIRVESRLKSGSVFSVTLKSTEKS